MDDRVDLTQRQAVKAHGLDDLKALVHQRRGVDGDLRTHCPVRVPERVGLRLSRKLLRAQTVERPARAGQNEALDLAAVAAALEALEDRAVLAVDGDDLRAAALRRIHDELARADERFLVRKRDAFFLLDRRERRLESDHAHYSGDDRVGVVRRGRGQKALHTGEHLGVCVGKPRAELARRILVIKHGKTRAKFPRLLFNEVNALIRRQRGDGKPQLARHLKRLAADGAGGTE